MDSAPIQRRMYGLRQSHQSKGARMIKMYPIEIEAFDELDALIFKVTCFDEVTSHIDIKTLVSPSSWPEIAAKIGEALKQIHDN